MHLIIRTTVVLALAALIGAAVAAGSLSHGALDGGTAESLATIRASNAPFANLDKAQRAGYSLLKDAQGVSCIAMDPMPGMPAAAMGVHYAKSALVGDGLITPETPEALVYRPLPGGKLQLAAVEYVVLKADWDAGHKAEPELFGHRFALTPAGNRFGLPAFYSLHVWLYDRNPSGQFAMWNPRVSCNGAT